MKKFICALLAALLCLPFYAVTGSAGEAPEQPAAEAAPADQAAPVPVSYDKLEELVTAGNPAVAAVNQAYDKIKVQIDELERQDQDLSSRRPGAAYVAILINIRTNVKNLKKALGDEDKDTRTAIGSQLFAARMLYLKNYALAAQLESLNHGIANANEDLTSYKSRYELGVLPYSAVDTFEKNIKTMNDGTKALQRSIESNLSGLAALLGIAGKIELAGFPEIDTASIAARDYNADLAAYTLSAPDVQTKRNAVESAQKAYNDTPSDTNKFALDTAESDYAKAQATAAVNFPDVYKNLTDEYSDYVTSTTVSDAQSDLDKAERRYALGLIPKTALTSARRALDAAELKYGQDSITLCIDLLQYEFNLINWDDAGSI